MWAMDDEAWFLDQLRNGRINDTSRGKRRRHRDEGMVTPRRDVKVSDRSGRVVEVIRTNRDLFSIDHEYVIAHPEWFAARLTSDVRTRRELVRMAERKVGHRKAPRQPSRAPRGSALDVGISAVPSPRRRVFKSALDVPPGQYWKPCL
jgi:hypothetical protein